MCTCTRQRAQRNNRAVISIGSIHQADEKSSGQEFLRYGILVPAPCLSGCGARHRNTLGGLDRCRACSLRQSGFTATNLFASQLRHCRICLHQRRTELQRLNARYHLRAMNTGHPPAAARGYPCSDEQSTRKQFTAKLLRRPHTDRYSRFSTAIHNRRTSRAVGKEPSARPLIAPVAAQHVEQAC